MPADVTVFVVFDPEEIPTPLDISKAAVHISREQPRWSIGAVGNHSFRLGRYDELPVLVSFRHDPDVLEESQLMAKPLDATSSASQRLERGAARFEFVWDLRRDQDVLPETATLVVSCAQALARLSKGVILVSGSRIVPDDVEFDDGRAGQVADPASLPTLTAFAEDRGMDDVSDAGQHEVNFEARSPNTLLTIGARWATVLRRRPPLPWPSSCCFTGQVGVLLE